MQRCEELSRQVETACTILIISEVFLIANAAAINLFGRGPFAQLPWLTLMLTGVAWLGTLILNYRLLSCGSQNRRFTLAPRTVNRPEFLYRMAFHLIINWSAIAAALIAGFVVGRQPFGVVIGNASIALIAAVWLSFNILHRRSNQLKNFVLTSTIAAALILAALALVTRQQ